MKTSTRLVLLLTLVLAQASTMAAGVGLAVSHKHKSTRIENAPVRLTEQATPVLSVYPNPSRGLVTVAVTPKAADNYKLRLSNIIGREVRLIALRPDLEADGLQVNLSDLPTGVYFYSLLVNDKVISTKRLILQN